MVDNSDMINRQMPAMRKNSVIMTFEFVAGLITLFVALSLVAFGEHAKGKVAERIPVVMNQDSSAREHQIEYEKLKIHALSRIIAGLVVVAGVATLVF